MNLKSTLKVGAISFLFLAFLCTFSIVTTKYSAYLKNGLFDGPSMKALRDPVYAARQGLSGNKDYQGIVRQGASMDPNSTLARLGKSLGLGPTPEQEVAMSRMYVDAATTKNSEQQPGTDYKFAREMVEIAMDSPFNANKKVDPVSAAKLMDTALDPNNDQQLWAQERIGSKVGAANNGNLDPETEQMLQSKLREAAKNSPDEKTREWAKKMLGQKDDNTGEQPQDPKQVKDLGRCLLVTPGQSARYGTENTNMWGQNSKRGKMTYKFKDPSSGTKYDSEGINATDSESELNFKLRTGTKANAGSEENYGKQGQRTNPTQVEVSYGRGYLRDYDVAATKPYSDRYFQAKKTEPLSNVAMVIKDTAGYDKEKDVLIEPNLEQVKEFIKYLESSSNGKLPGYKPSTKSTATMQPGKAYPKGGRVSSVESTGELDTKVTEDCDFITLTEEEKKQPQSQPKKDPEKPGQKKQDPSNPIKDDKKPNGNNDFGGGNPGGGSQGGGNNPGGGSPQGGSPNGGGQNQPQQRPYSSPTPYYPYRPSPQPSPSVTPVSIHSCPDTYEPVCGTDGVTYYNECAARKAIERKTMAASIVVRYVEHPGMCENDDEQKQIEDLTRLLIQAFRNDLPQSVITNIVKVLVELISSLYAEHPAPIPSISPSPL